MIRARVEAVRNINSAVEENRRRGMNIQNRGEIVVELDGFKTVLNAYEEPLKEMRDSL